MVSTGTVSAQAQAALDHFVARSAKSSLAQEGGDLLVVPSDEIVGPEYEIVMLTVSSYLFRLVMFIHFDRTPATRNYFATLAGASGEVLSDERLIDVVMERGNLFCGALNRDLSPFFPHIGMSTPCLLHRSCLDHVPTLQPAVARNYRAEAAPGVVLHFTLALCAFADLDFAHEADAVEEASGELEMF